MIQRIQTVFLALAGLSGFSLFLKPMDFALVSGVTEHQAGLSMLADGIYDINDNDILMILTVMLGLIPIIGIFLFKNRKLQMNVGRLAIVIGIVLLAVAGFFFYQEFDSVKDVVHASMGAGLAAPVLSFVFLYLANRAIGKDEKLVRSADRLR